MDATGKNNPLLPKYDDSAEKSCGLVFLCDLMVMKSWSPPWYLQVNVRGAKVKGHAVIGNMMK